MLGGGHASLFGSGRSPDVQKPEVQRADIWTGALGKGAGSLFLASKEVWGAL